MSIHDQLKNYWFILIAQVLLLFVASFMEHHISLSILFIITLFGIFGSAIKMIWTSTLPRMIAILSAAFALMGGFSGAIPGISAEVYRIGLIICCFSYAAFIFIAILSVGRHVFITDHVTSDRVIGSICVYMLIGMFFAFLYGAIALISHNAFDFDRTTFEHELIGLRDFLYFSYSTLTTIGYGDIVPANPFTKTLACLEGISGSVYLAIMVARLVGMQIVHESRKG